MTEKITIKRDEFEKELRNSRYGAAIIAMADAWFEGRESVTFHDPLAAATIFEPQICDYQSGHIEIEIEDSKRLGFTHWNAEQSQNHRIATAVDVPQFFQLYFQTISI